MVEPESGDPGRIVGALFAGRRFRLTTNTGIGLSPFENDKERPSGGDPLIQSQTVQLTARDTKKKK